MVGAEGFEGSFPSDRYAVFFVRFEARPLNLKDFPEFLSVSFCPGFSHQWTVFRKIFVSFRITKLHHKLCDLAQNSGLREFILPPRKELEKLK